MRTRMLRVLSVALAICMIVALSGAAAHPRAFAQERTFKLWYYEPTDRSSSDRRVQQAATPVQDRGTD